MEAVERKFNEMGAKVNIGRAKVNRRNENDDGFSIDITHKDGEEIFDIILQPKNNSELSVLQIDKLDRHLLLLVREGQGIEAISQKFLCGHDERHWFVAGVSDVSTVWAAKESLKPRGVRANQEMTGVKRKNLQKRRNKGFVRQGEWFFIPAPSVNVDPNLIIKKEPLQRGAGTPHIAEEVYRFGGESVRVCRRFPEGLNEREYKEELKLNPEIEKLPWEYRLRNAGVYVRGKVRHPDHKIIELKGWHRVESNMETLSKNVAFVD